MVFLACTSVRLPPEVFTPIQMSTYSAVYMQDNLTLLDEAPGLFEIPPPEHVDSSLVTVRGLMLLPAPYVPLLIQGRGYAPKEVWNLLIPAIVEANQEEACRPLIDWLRAASTARGVDPDSHAPLPPPFSLNFSGPPADEDLITHRARILKLLLPGLSTLSGGIENALTTMATAIVQQTDEARTARENKKLEDETPKLPSNVDKFKHTLHILMKLLNLDDEEALPVLWHEWANCGRKQELHILKDLLDNYAQSQHRFIAKSPIITPKLVQDIIAFNFIGEHRNDVMTGLSPFAVIEGGEAHHKHNLELAKIQGSLYHNEVSFNLSDLDALQKRELKAVPLCYFDLEKSLGLFGNLLGVVLGNEHIITSSYRQFWELLSASARDDVRDQIDVQYSIRPAHIIRSVQLIVHTWFASRRLTGTPPTPHFTDILLRIQTSSYQLPGLPGIYHDLTYSIKQPVITTTTPLTSFSSRDSSDLSTLSGSIHPSPLATAGGVNRPPPTSGHNTFVRNMDPDTALQAMIPTHLQLRTVIKNDPVPVNDANLPMCLSFHLRRGCWSQCKRASDHNRKLSAAERQRVVTFISTQLAKLSAVLPPVATTGTSGTIATLTPQGSVSAPGHPPSRG